MLTSHARTLAWHGLIAAVALTGLSGCLKRTISITTEPEGALVWLNDVEVGRTPLETDFTFYGTYDVRIRREGYEPIVTSAKASAPPQEWPGVDLAAEAIPVTLSNTVRWHWVLTPRQEVTMDKAQSEASVVERARELRSRATPATTESAAPAQEPAPTSPDPAPASEPAPATASPSAPPAPEPAPATP